MKLSTGKEIPVEMHKTRMLQKINLAPAHVRLESIREGGYNTFLMKSENIFLDMLTDSGVNAMSDNQFAAFMNADDCYAGSATFYEFEKAVKDILGYKYVMNVHQGRAAEHLIPKVFSKPGDIVPTNYHFTTTRAHIEILGCEMPEIFKDESMNTQSTYPFKGEMDPEKLKALIKKHGAEKIAFVRMEATANLMGGQPFSMKNLREIKEICAKNKIMMVLDGSLMSENAFLITQREKGYENKTVAEVVKEICSVPDLYYMSGRKNTCVRGGCIATNNEEIFMKIKPWLPVYEGFFTYGGMSQREVAMMAIGMREMVHPDVAGSTVGQIKYAIERLVELGVPVVTPPGGLGIHLDAARFLPHLQHKDYPAGALCAALYIASGIRSMERGTVSMDRDPKGNERYSELELTRLAVPRRVYSISHLEYAIDRIHWLHKHRDLIGGLKFTYEPPVLRFFLGKLEPIGDWGAKLSAAVKKDFGDY
jgi:tyrosine phenol-lyase